MAKLIATGGHAVDLNHAVNTVGSDASNTIPIAEGLGVDEFHFALTVNESGALIKPAAEARTLVNGVALESERALADGDSIQAGSLVLSFESEGMFAAAEAPRMEAALAPIAPDQPEAEEFPNQKGEFDAEPTVPGGEPLSAADHAPDADGTDADEPSTPEEEPAEENSEPALLFSVGGDSTNGASPATAQAEAARKPALLDKIGAGAAILAMVAAAGMIGWQGRGFAKDLLVTFGFGSRDHFHYVEKYAPSDTLVAGSIKPVDLFQAVVYHASSMTGGLMPDPEMINSMMKEQTGVNIYDFDRVSFAGNPAGTLTVVVSLKGEIPETLRSQIESSGEARKAGGLEVYGNSLPDGSNAEVAIADSQTLVAVLNGSFSDLPSKASGPAQNLIARLRPMDGTLVFAGNIDAMLSELPAALAKTGAPLPSRQINEAVTESKKFFAGIDSFVFSLTLGDDTNTIVTDMFTKPGAELDLGALAGMFKESRDQFMEKSSRNSPEAIVAQANAILDSAKFSPIDSGLRFSMEVTNEQIGALQAEARKAEATARKEHLDRQQEMQQKLQEMAAEGQLPQS